MNEDQVFVLTVQGMVKKVVSVADRHGWQYSIAPEMLEGDVFGFDAIEQPVTMDKMIDASRSRGRMYCRSCARTGKISFHANRADREITIRFTMNELDMTIANNHGEASIGFWHPVRCSPRRLGPFLSDLDDAFEGWLLQQAEQPVQNINWDGTPRNESESEEDARLDVKWAIQEYRKEREALRVKAESGGSGQSD